jgi:hypothetical protein
MNGIIDARIRRTMEQGFCGYVRRREIKEDGEEGEKGKDVRTEIRVDVVVVARTPTWNVSGIKRGVSLETGKKERQLTIHINTNNRRRRSQLLQAALRLDEEV